MPFLRDVSLPDHLTAIFAKGGVDPQQADIHHVLMAGALLSDDDEIGAMDQGYLEGVIPKLIADGQKISQTLTARAGNLSFHVDVFDLHHIEKFQWAIFCDFFVDKHLVDMSLGAATVQSRKTFEYNAWTNAFAQAGLLGFTVVGHDHCFDRMKDLALRNNEGISMSGEEYIVGKSIPCPAQDFVFEPVAGRASSTPAHPDFARGPLL